MAFNSSKMPRGMDCKHALDSRIESIDFLRIRRNRSQGDAVLIEELLSEIKESNEGDEEDEDDKEDEDDEEFGEDEEHKKQNEHEERQKHEKMIG